MEMSQSLGVSGNKVLKVKTKIYYEFDDKRYTYSSDQL